jgi:hypothetical protein
MPAPGYTLAGVTLTEAERLECVELVWWRPQNTWDHARRTIHRYAMAHGLPEIPGLYGANLETGEILIPGTRAV